MYRVAGRRANETGRSGEDVIHHHHIPEAPSVAVYPLGGSHDLPHSPRPSHRGDQLPDLGVAPLHPPSRASFPPRPANAIAGSAGMPRTVRTCAARARARAPGSRLAFSAPAAFAFSASSCRCRSASSRSRSGRVARSSASRCHSAAARSAACSAWTAISARGALPRVPPRHGPARPTSRPLRVQD